MTGILPNGSKTASVRIMTVKDKDHYTWHTSIAAARRPQPAQSG